MLVPKSDGSDDDNDADENYDADADDEKDDDELDLHHVALLFTLLVAAPTFLILKTRTIYYFYSKSFCKGLANHFS